MKKVLLLFILLLNSYLAFGQNGITFKTDKQFYIKGNSKLIGNTILSTSAKKAFNNPNTFNDALNLKYTDVDEDKNTFSSSQAELQIPENKKIKYAALYWSAIYKYNKGVKKTKGKYIVYAEAEKSLPNVNEIYFKTPSDTVYQSINGSVIFDSKNTTLFKDTQPYLCYADVTSIIQNTSKTNGLYTVANIKATQGYVSGGSAGGWLLYIIYENEEDTKKYFTTYNGFLGVDNTEVIIDFYDYKTNDTGLVNTFLLLATLEGDYKIKTDACAIKDPEKDRYIKLSTETRDKNNFFNSTITSFSQDKRNPSSLNTLGLDILKTPILNKNNTIIKNSSTNTSVKLSAKMDGFYLFFVAFETEISETFVPNINEKIIVDKDLTPNSNLIKDSTNLVEKDSIVINHVDKSIEVISQPNSKVVEQKKTTEKEDLSVKTSVNNHIKPVYLLVTNAFKFLENAIKWKTELVNKGYNAKMHFNPENNLYYIYILKDYNKDTIIKEKNKLLNNGAFTDLNIKAFFL